MKTVRRVIGLSVALTLAGLAATSGATLNTCTYRCRSVATGQLTIVQSVTSEADCCNGNVVCPTGSTYFGTLSFNGAHGPVRCIA